MRLILLLFLVPIVMGQIKVYANLTADRMKEFEFRGFGYPYVNYTRSIRFNINNSGFGPWPAPWQWSYLFLEPWNGCNYAIAVQLTGAGEKGFNGEENKGAAFTHIKNITSTDKYIRFGIYSYDQPWTMYIGYLHPPCKK